MTWTFKAIGFFGTGLGKVVMVIAAISSLIGLRALDVGHQRGVGAKNEQVRVETVGNKVDAKAQKKRQQVEKAKPSEIDDALRKYCRDC